MDLQSVDLLVNRIADRIDARVDRMEAGLHARLTRAEAEQKQHSARLTVLETQRESRSASFGITATVITILFTAVTTAISVGAYLGS